MIMAAVDVARAANTLPNKHQLQEDIIQRTTDEYAIASGSPYAVRCATQLTSALLAVPFTNWNVIAGPVLVSRSAELGNPIDGPLPLAMDQHAFVLKSF